MDGWTDGWMLGWKKIEEENERNYKNYVEGHHDY